MVAVVVMVIYSIARFSNTIRNFDIESRNRLDFDQTDHMITLIRQLRQLRHLCALFLAGNGSSRANTTTASDVRNGFSDVRALLHPGSEVDCALEDALEASKASIYGVIQYGLFWQSAYYGRPCDAEDYISEFLTFAENRTLAFDLDPEVIFLSFVQVIEALRLRLVDRLLEFHSSSGRMAVATSCYETWLEAEDLCSTLGSLTAVYVISARLGPIEIALFRVSASLLSDLSAALLTYDPVARKWTSFQFFDSPGELFSDYLTYALPVPQAPRWWPEGAEKYTQETEAQTDGMRQTLRGFIWEQDDDFRRSVAFDVVLWFFFILLLTPLIFVNSKRTILAIYVYHLSFENKESELKKEKRKTEALLNEMLPRYSPDYPHSKLPIVPITLRFSMMAYLHELDLWANVLGPVYKSTLIGHVPSSWAAGVAHYLCMCVMYGMHVLCVYFCMHVCAFVYVRMYVCFYMLIYGSKRGT